MDKFKITGPTTLRGEVAVAGAKNSALPILCAGLLSAGDLVLKNIPPLQDVQTLTGLLRAMGATLEWVGGNITLRCPDTLSREAPYDLVRKMRASFLVFGPLLARFGTARVSLPGGCAIGVRPVDIHLQGLERLGATITIAEGGYVVGTCPRLKGATVPLSFPSVGATENIMMAASLAEGTTVIENCAREPEIEDLAHFINSMGGKVRGAGGATITIEGVKSLGSTTYEVIPDRIEAGTLLIAGAITRGSLTLTNGMKEHLAPLLDVFDQIGLPYEIKGPRITVKPWKSLRPLNVDTAPHPGFPTDMQAQLMTLLCLAEGTSTITENVFENRFMHVPELVRMGGQIKIQNKSAVITGPVEFHGAPVMVSDLRAGAALVLAALTARGESLVQRIYHIDRGYDGLEKKLGGLGASILRLRD